MRDQIDAAQRNQFLRVLLKAGEQVRQFQLFALCQRMASEHVTGEQRGEQQRGQGVTHHRDAGNAEYSDHADSGQHHP